MLLSLKKSLILFPKTVLTLTSPLKFKTVNEIDPFLSIHNLNFGSVLKIGTGKDELLGLIQ